VVSGYRRNGFMDMGSLTHPAYRGRRLAPAALAAASALTFELGLIPQYRCDAHNTASRRVAEVTGYTLYFTNEALTVTG
jgi:RimJ/RimL family protein N-acetyltransferase